MHKRTGFAATVVISLALICAFCALPAHAAIYVKWDSDQTSDGDSWATAYRTIQEAVDDPGAASEPIYVAGAEKRQGPTGLSAGNYVGKVVLSSGVRIYGGYEGAGTPGKRDPRHFISIIDAEGNGDAVTTANSTTIDGFKIINFLNGVKCTGTANVSITGNDFTSDIYAAKSVVCELGFSNVDIIGNRIIGSGGTGISCTGGTATISENWLNGNCGPGVYCKGNTRVTIERNWVCGNTWVNNGLGASIWSESNTNAIIAGNYVVGNRVRGIHVKSVSGSSVIVTNNTIAGQFEGISLQGGAPVISNNIVVFNNAGISNSTVSPATPTLTCNDVYGNATNYVRTTAGTGDISTDPQFADWEHGNLHIQASSLCRDAGTNSAPGIPNIDMDGQSRIIPEGGTVDIGADESDGLTVWPPSTPRMIYVSSASIDGGDGTSWERAYRTIKEALLDAQAGNTAEIWVAKGTYNERVVMQPFVYLYGGFVGSESERTQRPALPRRPGDANESAIDAAGGKSSAVIGATAATIDGFAIRNGTGFAPKAMNPPPTCGGAIYCLYVSPIISNNTITGNTAVNGGAIYCGAFSSPIISNNLITGNEATLSGGGIHCDSGSGPAIAFNVIAWNSVSALRWGNPGYGGGIYAVSSTLSVTNNLIVGNSGGYHFGSGGGVYSSSSTAVIANNVIGGNGVPEYGGGIFCDRGSAVITNNTITGNSSKSGAITSWSGANHVIANNIVAHNSSGMFVYGTGLPALKNNDVYGNAGGNYAGISDQTGTSGNISENPKFADWKFGNVHISPDSPCRDRGDDSAVQAGWVDQDRQGRTQGDHVDIGADESGLEEWGSGPYSIIRVSPNGNDTNDGGSWVAPKRTVQAALDTAAAVGGEVWVAGGTYNERIRLRSYSYLYGGFAGTETSRTQRDWVTNVTVLDGGAAGSVVTARLGGPLSSIDGFTIQNGSGTTNDSERLGGGIYCGYGAISIANNIVARNHMPNDKYCFGTGIYCTDCASPTISNNIIRENTNDKGEGRGAGIFCDFEAGPVIINNTVVANIADYPGGGGGIYCGERNHAQVSNNIVAYNSTGMLCYKTAAARNNDVFGNTFGDYLWTPNLTGIDGNISADPMFVDFANGDYQLRDGSPCIDAGNGEDCSAWDMAGCIRPQDGNGDGIAIPDIGAFEHPLSLGGAKKSYQDGSPVALGGASVTASFDGQGYVYVEEPDRSSGIRVATSQSFSPGSMLNVVGTVQTDPVSGERYIAATDPSPNLLRYSPVLRPFGLVTRALGGGPLGTQEGVWGWTLSPKPGDPVYELRQAAGLNNIGLLVKVCGKVTTIDPEGAYFYINDGSGLRDGTKTLGVENIGLRVSSDGTQLLTGQWLQLTGISSCFRDGEGKLLRLLRVASSVDIRRQ